MHAFKTTRILVLAVGLLGLTGPSILLAQSGTPAAVTCAAPTGVIVSAPSGNVASPSSPGLVALDAATGNVLRSIQIPLVTQVYPTNYQNHLIARTGIDLYDVDIETGDAIRLDFGDVKPVDLLPNYVQTRGSAGKRLFILGDVNMANAFVVDLETGKTTNLVTLIRATSNANAYAGNVAVSSDDAHVVMWDGKHVYLIDASDFSNAVQLDGADFTYGPTFSSDGSTLIYSRSLADNSGSELVAHPLDGAPARVIQSSSRVAITLPVPGAGTLLVDDRSQDSPGGSLSLLDIASEHMSKLLDYSGSVLSVQFNPEGTRAIVGIDDPNGRTWTLLDLTAGTHQPVVGAAESNALPGLYGNSTWATFIPLDLAGVGTAGGFYGGMDLVSGVFHRFFDANKLTKYAPPQLSADGRRVLLQATTNPESQLWLLDNQTGESRMLATSLATTGQFSPNGCWAAVAQTENVDGLRTTVVSLMPAAGDAAAISMPNGRVLAWLKAPER